MPQSILVVPQAPLLPGLVVPQAPLLPRQTTAGGTPTRRWRMIDG
ncbi:MULTISPECIES: hypothetical protein [unclassified Rhodococcus (in: high G+C Gram-positive bacteria)]|nr:MULTISPECIES: hypothetical protein [unclassified Rhodococcus (in: high G+C Gram-positive bacteria)]